MSESDNKILTPDEERLLRFDEEVTIALVEAEREDEKKTRFLLTDTINEWGFISPAR